jgi:hypothetical protein
MFLLRSPLLALGVAAPLLFSPLFSPAPHLQAQELVRAAKAGRLDAVKALLAEDPGLLDVTDESGYTPLRWAGIRGEGEIARLLVEAGADPNSVGADGGTPLHGAAHHDDGEMMAALMAAGGDINAQNQWGRTPLHVASRRGCLEVAGILLDAGADPNATTAEGWSTLHVANRGGHPDLAALLQTRGADPNLRDAEGLLPGEVTLVRPEVVSLTRRQTDQYVGHYDLGGGFGFDVWRVGDRMHLREFAPDEMVPVAVDTFYAVQEPWRVVFHRDEDGAVSGMDVEFLRRTVSALKVVNTSAGYSYVGSTTCRECHSTEDGGGPFGAWVTGRHHRAWATLTTDQAKALAASREEYREITDPSQDQRCLMCHVTAAQNPPAEWRSGARGTDEGVGCEACHGPGSAYIAPEVMTDRDAFLANGGRIPDELTCRHCHRDEAFDFIERLELIRH